MMSKLKRVLAISPLLIPSVLLCLVAAPAQAQAQARVQTQSATLIQSSEMKQLLSGLGYMDSANPGMVLPGGGVMAGAQGAAGAAADPRLQQLMSLIYDRRPSVILKAWSTPPVEPDDEEAVASDEALPESEGLSDAETSTVDETEPSDPAEAIGDEVEAPAEVELTPEEQAQAAAQAAAQTAAESAAAEAAAEATRLQEEAEAIAAEMLELQRNVTLGNWGAVREYFAGLKLETAKAGYNQLLTSLMAGPPPTPGRYAQWSEKNSFGAQDITGLAACSPEKLPTEQLNLLGGILNQALVAGTLLEEVLVRFRSELEDESVLLRHQGITRVLFAAGRPLEAGEFLPPLSKAIANDSRTVLNLIARYELARHADEHKTEYLRNAWKATQAVLEEGDVEEEVKLEALERAVLLAPQIREELGADWLERSFSDRPQRGMEILAMVGAKASTGLFTRAREPEQRLESLQLQTTAANALVARAPELAGQWRQTLGLLAANWLEEAEYSYLHDTSSTRSPMMQQDFYGNVFYSSWNSGRVNQNIPQAIATGELLEIRPSDEWLAILDRSIRPKYAMQTAQLLLKINEDAEAFPYIEDLATDYPDRATELVNEFLRVWANNHNPNSNQGRTNQYMFMYGYNQRAGGIPLTRSKQERNLAELADWVARLRALPMDGIDEKLLANAFTNAHSSVEVYRIETIQGVFGDLGELDPEILAELVQRMRANLATVWRDPAAQKDAGTQRRKKDIQNEVLGGYEVARSVITNALAGHAGDWHLVQARAAILHDENNYRQELGKDPEFSSRRSEAFEHFRLAASLYREGAAERPEEDDSIDPYTMWFYAVLGACDLGAIDSSMLTAESQVKAIREELDLLEGAAADRHRGMFANALFTRMSSASAAVKFRYIRTGLAIVGDHERSEDSREILEFYDDLVTEIQLDVRVDGTTRVGGNEPFGLYVDLRHTREIEREAGGFGKYLVNQNKQTNGFNYGRPTEDYREKFEETAREALQEHFDVLSVTFNHPDAHSIALEEYGWRKTPYAYILLKPSGPQIDRVPSLRMDLDFLDTTGYVVLPIESAPIAIDASQADSGGVHCEELQITQTLDERQASEGKLMLEIRAQALGPIPDLDDIVELDSAGFSIASLEDQGLSITKFDELGDGSIVRAERIWMITLAAQEGLEELPESFTFGTSLVENTEEEFQRYSDADLVRVERKLDLEYTYGELEQPNWFARSLGFLAVVGLGWFGFRRMNSAVHAHATAAKFSVPETLTPFTVIGLLGAIETDGGLSPKEREDLKTEIDSLQKYYFEESEGPAPDLAKVATTWTGRAS